MTNIRPCPGVAKRGCGKARKANQAYCEECGREYQRDRYRANRTAAGEEYRERVYTRAATEKCLVCRRLPQDGILAKCAPPFDKHVICDLCVDRVRTVRLFADRTVLARIAQFYEVEPLEFNPERLAFTLANAKQQRAQLAVSQRTRAISEANYYRPGMSLENVTNTPEWAEKRIQELQNTEYRMESRANALLYYNEYCAWLQVPQLQTLFGFEELDLHAPVDAWTDLVRRLEPYLQYL